MKADPWLRTVLLTGWVMMSPHMTMEWTWTWDCKVTYDEQHLDRLSAIFDTQEHCEAFRSELVRREQTGKDRRIANGKEREHQLGFLERLTDHIFFSASSSDLCEAKGERWSHSRCVEVAPPDAHSPTEAEGARGSRP